MRRNLGVILWLLGVLFPICGDVPAEEPPIRWVPPPSFDAAKPGLGLPLLKGVTHSLLYDPLPCRGNVDEGGDGRFEGLRYGTFNHHQQIVLFEDKFIVFWTNHSRDENGPGERVLGKAGTFKPGRTEVDWGGDETLLELAPAPVALRRRKDACDPDVITETHASAALQVINGRLYVMGSLIAWHGWTDDVKYHGGPSKPIPEAHWRDGRDRKAGFQWDLWWGLGLKFVQRWKVVGRTLAPDSPLYKISEPVTQVEVTPGRFKKGAPLVEPYASARPFAEAPVEMREDIVHGKPQRFARTPKYAPGTSKLAADGKNGLAHQTEFKCPDGHWVVVRDNLVNPDYYYAAVKARPDDCYPPAVRTNLFGHAMPVAGELSDGRPWIICNSRNRQNMYITLSDDGIVFDKTWLLLHAVRQTDGGMHKGGGPQYFQAVTVDDNIWVVYSIGKEQIGVTRVPIRGLGGK